MPQAHVEILRTIAAKLRARGLEPRDVALEVAQRRAADNVEQALQEEIRALGLDTCCRFLERDTSL